MPNLRGGAWIARVLRGVLVPVLLLVAASIGLVAHSASQHRAISPYDEYVYIDYLAKIPTQGIVRGGEETGEVARQALACRGVLNYVVTTDRCDGHDFGSDAKYPYAGGTGADIYSPVYFAVTWTLAQPLIGLGVDFVDAGRLVGAFWLALGAVGVWALLRALRVDGLSALGLGLLVVATPVAYWSNTYISTDAPSVAAGAWLGVAGVAVWERRRAAYVLLPVAAAIATLLKVQNIAAVGAVSLALMLGALTRPAGEGEARPTLGRVLRDRRLLVAVLTVAVAVVAQAAWLVIRARAQLPGERPSVDTAQPLSVHAIVAESLRFITNIGVPGFQTSIVTAAVVGVLGLLSVAAVIGLIVDQRFRSGRGLVAAVSVLVVSLLLGPLLAVFTRVSMGYYTPLSERYGIVLLPLFLALIGLFLAHLRRVVPWVVVGAGALAAAGAIMAGTI
ncbi:hypothetical protein IT072_05945 [Leifsonia sp. ZF2019]|uniref:hypothetical protein n=1 Tax=Leifsonia sp. ZF2019 TaxID=2781978 RepID=UPI001CBE30C6|nr:hypothetical protein [Leifsonia sp. ZF2019]UAJ80564.1 hypothetical protein IT072_05945 [Leifsonia sp. ZF2019]